MRPACSMLLCLGLTVEAQEKVDPAKDESGGAAQVPYAIANVRLEFNGVNSAVGSSSVSDQRATLP